MKLSEKQLSDFVELAGDGDDCITFSIFKLVKYIAGLELRIDKLERQLQDLEYDDTALRKLSFDKPDEPIRGRLQRLRVVEKNDRALAVSYDFDIRKGSE